MGKEEEGIFDRLRRHDCDISSSDGSCMICSWFDRVLLHSASPLSTVDVLPYNDDEDTSSSYIYNIYNNNRTISNLKKIILIYYC